MSNNIILGTDIGGDGQLALLAGVNAALGLSLTLNDVLFEAPELVSTPSPMRNSVIKMVPKAESGLYGVRRVFYNRIHVSELGVISVPRASAVNVSDLLVDISYKYGILITVDDIFDAPLPAPSPGVTSVEINFNFRPTSVIYYGDTKIILGNNDPSGGNTGGSTLFVPMQTLFGWAAEDSSNSAQKIDIFSTTIDQDKSRKRLGLVQDNAASLAGVYKRNWGPMEFAEAKGKPRWPIAGCWTSTTGAVRVIDSYGCVLEKDAASTGWGNVLSQAVALDYAEAVDIQNAQFGLPIKTVLQTLTGDVYLLVNDAGEMKLLVSTNSGTDWTAVTGLNTDSNSKVLDITAWSVDGLTIVDSIYHGNKLWFLYRNGNGSYGVESLDLTSKVTTINPVAQAVHNSSLLNRQFNSDKLSFAIPTQTMVTPSLVGAATLSNGLQPFVWWYNLYGSNYEPISVAHPLLDRDFLESSYTYVSAHSVELVKNTAWRVDSIEIGTSVATDTANTEFMVMSQARTLDKYKTYGLLVLTSLVSSAGRTKWVSSEVKLGDSDYPRPVRLQSLGRYANFHAQPEHSLARVALSEDSAVGGFVAAGDSSIIMEKSSQWRNTLPFGHATYTRPQVIENTFTSYQFDAGDNTEATRPDLNYSFIGKGTTANVWLTAVNTNTAFTKRTISASHSVIGDIPLAIGNMGTTLFLLSKNQTMFVSNNLGKSWEAHVDLRSFYQDDDHMAQRKLGSTAYVPLLSSSFKGGSLMNNSQIYEVSQSVTGLVFDKSLKEINNQRAMSMKVMLSVENSDQLNPNGWGVKTPISSYGLNFTGQHAPVQVKYWSHNYANNQLSANGRYTTTEGSPLAADYNEINILATTLPSGFEVLDVKHDVLYLDIKEVVMGRTTGGVYLLNIVDNNDAERTIQLFGGTKPANAGFRPDVSFYLWDYADANYVPLVYYTDKAVLLLGRLVEDGSFTDMLHLLTVPQDNGATLHPIPMLNKNRREYWFYQKGNGVFKLGYVYNPSNREVTFQLARLFSLAEIGLNDIDLHTGMVYGLTEATVPTVPLIPTFPPSGQFISFSCDGYTKNGLYHDGAGGTYTQEMETNSVDCGYVAPTPGPVAAPTASIIVNTATNGVVHTETTTDENGTAYVVYAFSNPLVADTNLVVDLAHVTTSGGDFASFDWRYDEESWNTLAMGTPLTVPAGATSLTVRVTYVDDAAAEGDETYILVLDKAAGNTQITSAAIETTITIQDPVAAPTTAEWSLRTSGMPGPSGNATNSTVNEGGYAYVVYELSNALTDDVSGIAISISSAHLGDLESIDFWDQTTNAWVPSSLNVHPTVLAGDTTMTYRVKIYEDDTTEGTEVMVITGTKNSSETRVTGPATIDHNVTINDTSNGLSTGPAALALETGFTGDAGEATTSGNVNEGGYAHFVYSVTPPVGYDITEPTISISVTGSNLATAADVTLERYNANTGNWTVMNDGDPVYIPAGAAYFTVRAYLKLDFETEVNETLQLDLTMNQGSQTTGPDVSHSVTILANNT